MKRVWVAVISLMLTCRSLARRCQDVPLRLPDRPGLARSSCAGRNIHAVVARPDLRTAGRARQESGTGSGARDEVGAAQPHDLALPSAAERQVPRRRVLYRRRRDLFGHAHEGRGLGHGLHGRDRDRGEEDRRSHRRLHPEQAQSDPAAADHLDLHDEQVVGREEQRRLAGQHQEQAGEFRDQQRQRHRRVQDRRRARSA